MNDLFDIWHDARVHQGEIFNDLNLRQFLTLWAEFKNFWKFLKSIFWEYPRFSICYLKFLNLAHSVRNCLRFRSSKISPWWTLASCQISNKSFIYKDFYELSKILYDFWSKFLRWVWSWRRKRWAYGLFSKNDAD